MIGAADRGRAPGGAAAGGGRRRLALAAVLAFVVVLQGALAPVLGLGVLRQGDGARDGVGGTASALLVTAICGPEGLRLAPAAAEGDASPGVPAPAGRHGDEGCCFACHAVPQAPGLTGPEEEAPLRRLALRSMGPAWVPNPAAESPQRPPLRPGAARAPPPLLS